MSQACPIMIGPDPIIRIDSMSVRRGIRSLSSEGPVPAKAPVGEKRENAVPRPVAGTSPTSPGRLPGAIVGTLTRAREPQIFPTVPSAFRKDKKRSREPPPTSAGARFRAVLDSMTGKGMIIFRLPKSLRPARRGGRWGPDRPPDDAGPMVRGDHGRKQFILNPAY